MIALIVAAEGLQLGEIPAQFRPVLRCSGNGILQYAGKNYFGAWGVYEVSCSYIQQLNSVLVSEGSWALFTATIS